MALCFNNILSICCTYTTDNISIIIFALIIFLFILFKLKIDILVYFYYLNKLYLLIYILFITTSIIYKVYVALDDIDNFTRYVCCMVDSNTSNSTSDRTPSLSNTNGSSPTSSNLRPINYGFTSAWSSTTPSELPSSNNTLPRSTGTMNLNELARSSELEKSGSSNFPMQKVGENDKKLPTSYSENYLDPLKKG